MVLRRTSSYHSPVIGWAYDGNPIYGPYGFTDPQGGNISQMISGYELIDNPTNRPPTSLFPLGYFVEDHIFTDRGDLDEHNGRFCVTPDYPKGRYCYFSTLNTFSVDSTGPFKNYKRPVYPYLIGDSFYSKPISTTSRSKAIKLITTLKMVSGLETHWHIILMMMIVVMSMSSILIRKDTNHWML